MTCATQNFLWFVVELDYLVEEIGFHLSADAKTRGWLNSEEGHSWLNSNLEYNIGVFYMSEEEYRNQNNENLNVSALKEPQ